MWITWPMRMNSFILDITRGPWSQEWHYLIFLFKNVSLASVWRTGSRRAIQEAGRPVRSCSGKSIGDHKMWFGLGYII